MTTGSMHEEEKRKKIEDLDHAFELVLIIVNILFTSIILYVQAKPEKELPLIISSVQKISVLLVFPIVLTLVAWVAIPFVDDETWKMRLRTFSWGSLILLVMIQITEFYVMSRNLPSAENMQWFDYIFMLVFLFGFLIPTIPSLLMRRILKSYGKVSPESHFFKVKGIRGNLNRYISFAFSILVFWSFFILTILV